MFSQDEVFTVHEYRLIQRGPAFANDAEAYFERASRQYRVQTTDRDDGEVEVTDGDLDEMPANLSNGMGDHPGQEPPPGRGTTVRMVAFTPSPKLIGLELEPVGTERAVRRRDQARHAVCHQAEARVPARPGAKLTGRDPPDSHAWIITEDVPAFAKFVGPLSMSGTGAVWRVEVTAPAWNGER